MYKNRDYLPTLVGGKGEDSEIIFCRSEWFKKFFILYHGYHKCTVHGRV